MDFSVRELDDETRRFWAEVREFLDEHLTDEVREHEWRTGDGFNEGLHLALGTKNWIFPTWPAEDGGAGLSPLQAAILERELTARHEPSITRGTTRLVSGAVRRYASAELKAEVLPAAARGEVRMSLGYTEPDTGSDLANVKTKAVRDGDEWTINGQKMFTTGAHNCQYTFLVTRTNPDVPKHKGLTMFLVPLDSPGVEIGPVHTLGGERTNMVYYDDVRVPDRFRLGAVDDGWRVVAGALNEEHGMDEDGPRPLDQSAGENTMYMDEYIEAFALLCEWAVDPSSAGALPGLGDRRPADDPITRRRLARIAFDLELSRMTPGPMGRIVGVENFIHDAAEMLDILGPAGLLVRGAEGVVAEGWLEYAHRFAQGTAIYGGTTDVHRNIIAEHFLGMPRSRPSSSSGSSSSSSSSSSGKATAGAAK
jgi:alkylation response protein AidB-like acyl-CoA dehydrogenase